MIKIRNISTARISNFSIINAAEQQTLSLIINQKLAASLEQIKIDFVETELFKTITDKFSTSISVNNKQQNKEKKYQRLIK